MPEEPFDLVCAGAMVPEPYDTSHYGYCEYFRAAGDEILCGGLAVCGQAFMNGLKPHSGETVVTYGKDAIFNPSYRIYSPENSTVKIQPGVLGLIPAIVNRGTTPVVVVRPSGVVTVPGRPFRLERYNFARFLYKTETVKDGKFRIEADEPLFLARIVRE